MKKIIICMLVLALTACQKRFEKHWDLAVDATSYTLPYTGDSFPLYVYCSNDWTATLQADGDWISILPGTQSGSGNGVVRIEYKDNDSAPREASLVLRSEGNSITVTLTQKYNSTQLVVL